MIAARRTSRWTIACRAAGGLILVAGGILAPLRADDAIDPAAVVATVGDEPITAREVARLVRKATAGQAISPAALPFVQAQVLDEIVAHRLVIAYARHAGDMPSEAEIAAATARFDESLKARGTTRAQFLETESLTESDFQRQIVWRLVWEKYRTKYLNGERVERYFREHQAEYDGTLIDASQILLVPSPDTGPQAWEALLARAAKIRAEVAAGTVSFADAARRYSSGPSAKNGGSLGAIARHGVMDEAFAAAAFALREGEISPPIRTRFGVHLIRCDRIRPGHGTLNEARDLVEQALSRELLDRLAAPQRRLTPVQMTGKMPYFKPGTRQIVPSNQPR